MYLVLKYNKIRESYFLERKMRDFFPIYDQKANLIFFERKILPRCAPHLKWPSENVENEWWTLMNQWIYGLPEPSEPRDHCSHWWPVPLWCSKCHQWWPKKTLWIMTFCHDILGATKRPKSHLVSRTRPHPVQCVVTGFKLCASNPDVTL